MNLFIVVYRYKRPGDKAVGPNQQYRLYAPDLRQAWELARSQANYPGIELIDVRPT